MPWLLCFLVLGCVFLLSACCYCCWFYCCCLVLFWFSQGIVLSVLETRQCIRTAGKTDIDTHTSKQHTNLKRGNHTGPPKRKQGVPFSLFFCGGGGRGAGWLLHGGAGLPENPRGPGYGCHECVTSRRVHEIRTSPNETRGVETMVR